VILVFAGFWDVWGWYNTDFGRFAVGDSCVAICGCFGGNCGIFGDLVSFVGLGVFPAFVGLLCFGVLL